MLTLIDVETTFQIRDNKFDPSVFNSENKLVSLGWWTEKTGFQYRFYYHEELISSDDIHEFQDILDRTTCLLGHNIKFDYQWLRSCGLKYKGRLYDTMIREYILNKGQKLGVSLEDSCIRNNVTHKKSDLVEKYLKDKIGFDKIPIDIVREYGIGDLESTLDLYNNQLKRLEEQKHLWPTIDLSEEFCTVLTDIENDGIFIDETVLNDLEIKYRKEYNELGVKLKRLAQEAMGDYPVNLNSPEQLSQLLYSRKVKDKDTWKKIFNLGTEIRGSVVKNKYPPKMSSKEFVNVVQTYTEIIYKQEAKTCQDCAGSGRIEYSISPVNQLQPNLRKCKICGGSGICYVQINNIAGFKLLPEYPKNTAVGGFSTNKQTIEELKLKAKGSAKDFLEVFTRYSAVDTYLNTFIEGIKKGLQNGKIHTSFMQCVTATGRLSSRNPNFQNMPRGTTFEVKQAITSRFKGGIITEADAKQLEFRIAGELSGDQQIYDDVVAGVDVHANTAKATGLSRQDSKPHTFAPVYGAVATGKTVHIGAYYDFFKEHYKGLCEAHTRWAESVLLQSGLFKLPSGREYFYPNTKRFFNGGISNSTIIKNYPVQGHATGDLIPVWCIEAWKLVRERKLLSKLILTVHDSLIFDSPPEEKEIIIDVLHKSWYTATKIQPKLRWNYEYRMPLEIEIKQGKNWLEMKDV